MTKGIVDVMILAEIMKSRNTSQFYLDKQTGRIIEITNRIIDAFEDEYYEHLSDSEMELYRIFEQIYDGSDKYVEIPKIADGDLINVIMEIVESLDEEDELREMLISIASSPNVQKKINYLIVNNEGFYKIWNKFYSKYVLKKAKSWALSMGLEVDEPEI